MKRKKAVRDWNIRETATPARITTRGDIITPRRTARPKVIKTASTAPMKARTGIPMAPVTHAGSHRIAPTAAADAPDDRPMR